MKRLILFFQVLLLLAVTGCQDDSGKNKGVPVSMKFYLFSRQNQLKDITVGVIADFPVNADNLKYTIKSDGTMEAADQLHWGRNQAESSAFFVYTPYNSGYTGKTKISVSVKDDQSTLANLKASDFAYAYLKAKPDNRGTDITLTHAFSILQIPLAVKGDDEIKSVEVDDIVPNEVIDAKTGEISLGATDISITAYKEPESNSFSFMFPPQVVEFKATVTFNSGRKVTLLADTPLSKWPGKIFRLDDITISPEDRQIKVQASRTVIKDWTTLALPENPAADPILSMSDLLAISNQDGKDVDLRLEGITITEICDAPGADMAIFEDKTGAAPIKLGGNFTEIMPGSKLSGLVTLHFAIEDGVRTITVSRANKADITKNQPVPLTEGTFQGLPGMREADTYRRTVFHNVAIVSAFSGGSAFFEQDGTRVRVLCEGQDGLAVKENRSDLIGFPVVYGDSMAIYIPNHTALQNFIVTREESGFTEIKAPGMYDISNMADPQVLFAYDGRNQLSTRKSSDGYETQISDLKLNKSLFIQLPGFDFTDGETYPFFVEAYGHYNLSKGDGFAECFYQEDNLIWLIDKADKNIGYIMAIEK